MTLREWAAERCLDLACWFEPSGAGIGSSLTRVEEPTRPAARRGPGVTSASRSGHRDVGGRTAPPRGSWGQPAGEPSLIRVTVPRPWVHADAYPMAGFLRELAEDVEMGVVVAFGVHWPSEPGEQAAFIALPKSEGEA